MAKKTTKLDFEGTLEELEALVSKMEGGELSLEESLQAFERGIKLTRDAQSTLKDAELRVKALIETDDGPVLEDIVEGADSDEGSGDDDTSPDGD